jgi:hypothetical protein
MKVSFCALVLALGIAAAAAAQSAKPMPLDQLAAYNKPDREKLLHAGAKAEGKVTWYTSLAGDSYKQLAAAFEAVSRRQRNLSRHAPGDGRRSWPRHSRNVTLRTHLKPQFRC